MANVLIKNGLVVDTEWTRHADVLIEGEHISRVAKGIALEDCPEGTGVIDAEGLCILPGIIDAHTHYHLVSRGTVTADSFIQGSRLAAFGGVTTVIDFADDNKVSLESSVDDRKKEMKDMAIDYSLHQGVYRFRDSLGKELQYVKDTGTGTIKIFTTYRNVGYLVEKREELKAIFSMCKDLGLMVSVHSEDDKIITDINDSWQGGYAPIDHAAMRPAEAEAAAITYVGGIAGELDMPVYIVHLSSKKGLEAVRALREEGVKVIVETTPHYLYLDKSALEGDKGPLYVMTPPLRTKEDNEALQEAVADGEVQVIATDHCSFTYEQKLESHDCRTIFPGIPGTEELLPLVNTLLDKKGLDLTKLVNLLSAGPAREFGLYPRKGSLMEGTDADLILFDPKEEWVLSKETTHSASGYTPYEGLSVKGKVKKTILRGKVIMEDGNYFGTPGAGLFIKAER